MRERTQEEDWLLGRRRAEFPAFVAGCDPALSDLATAVLRVRPDLAAAHGLEEPQAASRRPERLLPLLEAWLCDLPLPGPVDPTRSWLQKTLFYFVATWLRRSCAGEWHLEEDPDSPYFAQSVVRFRDGQCASPLHVVEALLGDPVGRSLLARLKPFDRYLPGVSPALALLVNQALAHGVELVRGQGPDRHPVDPFLWTDDAPRPLPFVGGDARSGVAAAREHVLRGEARLAVIAFDGVVTLDGRRTDAVVAQGAERGSGHSVVYVQPYSPTNAETAFHTVGEPVFRGRVADLFPDEALEQPPGA